jgi:hypothetical protein
MRRVFAVGFLFAFACARQTQPPPPQPQQSQQTQQQLQTPPAPTKPVLPAVKGAKLAPVDEGPRDASFAAYRQQLLDAVHRRDVDAVVALSDPKIRTSFGAGGGSAALREALARTGTWNELETILTHGGSFRDGMFWAPYVYSAWPEAHDAFAEGAIVGDNVSLRDAPDGKPIATLSYDLVKIEPSQNGWRRITTADGRSGFVEDALVRSPIALRAGFLKTGDKWRMNAFVSGD